MNARTFAARPLLALVVLAGALVSIGPAAAAEPTTRFEPIGAYDLEIAGKVIPKARMFNSRQAGAIVVMAAELPYPIAVVPRNKTVQQLNPGDLTQEALGSVAWTPANPPLAVATFDLIEQKPVFQLDGKKIRFLDKAPLLGPKTKAEILAYDPSYAYHAANANPPTVYLSEIEKWPQDVVIKIYFSTQCDVCRELLPVIFKFQEMLKNPKLKFEFYGMALPATKDPLAVELKITNFPTGIFYSGGKEIGRAQGHTWRMPDMAINNSLKGVTIDPDSIRAQPGSPQPGR